MRKFSSAVIGLGRIGQEYDYSNADDSTVLTHAAGFAYHEGFDLLGAVDPDETQRVRFEKKFGRPAYANLQTLMLHHEPEVFSIGVPTSHHFQIFQEVINYLPLAVLCEKPIAACVVDARNMLSMAEENNCALLVNYIRRFDPGVLALRSAIQNRDFGEIYKGTVWYTKGFMNNGSHFVDLARFLLGETTHFRIIEKGRDWAGEDPEPDVCVRFGKTSMYFLAAKEECFLLAGMELIGTKGMITYKESGTIIEYRKTIPHPVFSGYIVLSQEKQTIPTDLKRYQWHVLEALYQNLTKGTPLNSDGKSATDTLAVVESIFEQRKGLL